MLYRFKSKATADLIVLGDTAKCLLAHMGRDEAAQGVVQVDDQPQAWAALERAVQADEARRESARQAAKVAEATGQEPEPAEPREAISLRQRAWPLIDMLKRAHAEQADVLWGV